MTKKKKSTKTNTGEEKRINKRKKKPTHVLCRVLLFFFFGTLLCWERGDSESRADGTPEGSRDAHSRKGGKKRDSYKTIESERQKKKHTRLKCGGRERDAKNTAVYSGEIV
jgi:hypothetical protein